MVSALPPFDRRAFLRGTATLAALGWLLPTTATHGAEATPDDGDLPATLLASWPLSGAVTMARFAQAVLPSAAPALAAARPDTLRRCDDWYKGEPQEVQDRLALALRVLEYRPVVTRFTRFSHLPLGERREVLTEDFAQSRITTFRTISVSLTSLVLFNFLVHGFSTAYDPLMADSRWWHW